LEISTTELSDNVNKIIEFFKSKTPKMIKSENDTTKSEHLLYERKKIKEFKEIILFGIRAEIGDIYRDEESKEENAMMEEGGDYKTEKLKVLYQKKKLYDELTKIENIIEEYEKEKTENATEKSKLMNIALIESGPRYLNKDSTYEGYYKKDQKEIKTKFEFNITDWCIYINNKEHKIYEKLKIKHFYKEKYAFIIETENDSIIKIIYNEDTELVFDTFLQRWNAGIIDEIKDRKRAIKLINEGKTFTEFIYEGNNPGEIRKDENGEFVIQNNMRFGTNSGYYKIWDEEFKALNKKDKKEFTDDENIEINKFIETDKESKREKKLKNEKITEINYISLLTEEEKELIRNGVDLSKYQKFHEYLTENITQDEKNKLFEESQLKVNKINDEIDYLLKKHSVEQHTLLHEIINFDISTLIKTEKKAQDEYNKAIENSKTEIDAQKKKEEEGKKQKDEDAERIDQQSKGQPIQLTIQSNDEQQEESGESFVNNIVFTPYGFELVIDFTKFNLV